MSIQGFRLAVLSNHRICQAYIQVQSYSIFGLLVPNRCGERWHASLSGTSTMSVDGTTIFPWSIEQKPVLCVNRRILQYNLQICKNPHCILFTCLTQPDIYSMIVFLNCIFIWSKFSARLDFNVNPRVLG
ncbi:hypothetical protein BZA77DRAFT_297031 [Pyronema omphalodes]|nr:hypothetical protein BZA77DRAFT_297031 [Pyronema omphalodes]